MAALEQVSASPQCHHHTVGTASSTSGEQGWVLARWLGSGWFFSSGEGVGEEQGERNQRQRRRVGQVTPLFASFPPSLSKDAREAAAAAPQHFHPTWSCFPKGSGLEQSGELSILHPPPASSVPRLLPCLRGFGRMQPILGWLHRAAVGGEGGLCVCVCVWEGLLLIMCTLGRAGLVAGAQEGTGEPQVPQPPAGHIIPACLRFPRSWRHKWLSCRSGWDPVGLRELAV